MKTKIKITDKTGNNKLRNAVKFIDPDQLYPVSYTIKQDGTKVNVPTMLKGKDLTEPQIAELVFKHLI